MSDEEPSRPNGRPKQDQPEEFGRFENLMRKLTQVSKPELDAKLKAVKAAPSTRRK